MEVKRAGRIKIFTDQKEITRKNVLKVLEKSYSIHRKNVSDMQYLIDYEAGIQPLPYQKIVRSDIDIKTTDNMANYVTEFWKGYFWGSPPIYTQRGNKEHHNTNEDVDSFGISALNEMMINGLSIGRERQRLADFVEKTGIGHVIVNPKKDWDDEMSKGAYAEVHTLDSRCAFCVYYAGIGQKKVMGVSYAKQSGKLYFSVFTNASMFEIQGDNIKEYVNPLGMIPIVEYERAVDRTGRYERQISLMDNLNSMVSNFANDVAQKTQEIWWGNDIQFPTDEKTGEPIKPQSGQWLLTYTGGNGNNPKIEPMSSTFDSSPTLEAISNTRNEIMKRCFVPMQYSSEGGGSTGIATDTMSGWNATAVDADRQEQLISGADREVLILVTKAISTAPSEQLSDADPLRKIHASDVDIHYSRQKNYDLNSKINAVATAINIGVNGRHALKMGGGAWPDVEQVWIDSKETIEAYQQSLVDKSSDIEPQNRLSQDSSDQISQSPSVDGLSTDNVQPGN